jgi:thiol-disulfide isomerase/thioredoxin
VLSLAARLRRHWRAQWKSHLGTLALVVAVLAGVQDWQTRHLPERLPADTALQLLHPDGRREATTLAAWQAGHAGPVVLHVWAEWCPICRAEESSVTRLARDAPVLTIAMQSGPADAVARVLRQRELSWTTAVDPRGELARALGVRAVPAFVVMDPDGRLRAASVGYTSEIGMRLRLGWVRLWSARLN